MSRRVRQDGREAWRRNHGDGAVGGGSARSAAGSAMGAAAAGAPSSGRGARRPPQPAQRPASAPAPAPTPVSTPVPTPAPVRRRGGGPRERPPATSRDVRLSRRGAARERKAAVKQARQAAILRRAEELAAARAAATDNSALDSLIAEVQDKLYQKRGDIGRAFLDLFDKNRDGSVDRREITAAMEELLNKKIAPEQIDEVLARTDTDGDGDIDLNEFIAVLKIDDRQTRDIIPAAQQTPARGRSPLDAAAASIADVAVPPAQVERATRDWLTKRQQDLGDAGGISHIVRRNMLDGGDVRAVVSPPVGRSPKPIGLAEVQAVEAKQRQLERQAEIDRFEKGSEQERALRELAAVKKSRFDARVRTARANRQADAERSASVAEKAEKYDIARIAAKRFQREEWEGQAKLRDFYACGFHGSQQVEPDGHPSHVRRNAPEDTPAVPIEQQFKGGRRSEQNPFWTARADAPTKGPSGYVGVVGGRPPTPAKPVTYAWG